MLKPMKGNANHVPRESSAHHVTFALTAVAHEPNIKQTTATVVTHVFVSMTEQPTTQK